MKKELSKGKMPQNILNIFDEPRYLYTQAEIQKKFGEGVYQSIITTPEFQRLKGISFLGTIDVFDLFGTKYKFSRFDHSIGVALIAKKIAEFLNLDQNRTKTLIVASLLHDIGHPPLSHCLESIFSEHVRYACNGHHTQTRRLIVGSLQYKSNVVNLHKVLKKHSVNIAEISLLLSGRCGDKVLNTLMDNPFNPDTIDGINRAAWSFGEKAVATEDILKSFSILNGEVVLNLNYRDSLDAFWSLKNRIYNLYIYNPKNLIAEHFLSMLFEQIASDETNFKKISLMTDNDFLFYLFKQKKVQSFLSSIRINGSFLENFQEDISLCNTFEKRRLKKFIYMDNKNFKMPNRIKLSDAKGCYIRSCSYCNLPNDTKFLRELEQNIERNYLMHGYYSGECTGQ
ncbi:HD superfamily phosphohydrolase [Methanophagales archaeon]|nr:HD superfamily phosphohydrolase [Methanophagales archaeon]